MAFDLDPINVKDATGTSTPMIAYDDGTNKAFAHAAVDATGAIISPATSGLQTTGNSALATIASQTSGLATAAAQSTGNSSLATVATNTGNLDTNLGAKADSAASSDTGTFSVIAFIKRTLQNWTTLLARVPAVGSALAAASMPVALATDQLSTLATSANQTSSNTKLDTVIANTGAGAVHLTSSPTVAGTTHAANDVVGTKISLANAARVAAGSGIIQTVTVNVTDAVTAAYDVLFFGTDPSNSTFTDDAAINVVVADQPYLLGAAQCTTIIDCGTRKTLQAANVALPFKLSTGTTLYAVIVARGSAAFTTANGVVLNVDILQD